jgi:hypothetical protein
VKITKDHSGKGMKDNFVLRNIKMFLKTKKVEEFLININI